MRQLGPLGRLRALTAAVFLALALPAGVLVHQAWRDLRFEALHTQRVLAQELLAHLDARVRALVAAENARPATDYAFLNLAGDPRANFVQRSPLAAFPPPPDLPGVVGYFEVDVQGRFATPLLPPGADGAPYGVDADELAQRQALAARLAQVLARSRLVRAPVPAVPPGAPRERTARYAYEADAGRGSLRRDAQREQQAVEEETASGAPAGGAAASAPVGQAAFDALEARQRGTSGGEWKTNAAPAAQARKERSALPALADAAPAVQAPWPLEQAGPDGPEAAGAGVAGPAAAPAASSDPARADATARARAGARPDVGTGASADATAGKAAGADPGAGADKREMRSASQPARAEPPAGPSSLAARRAAPAAPPGASAGPTFRASPAPYPPAREAQTAPVRLFESEVDPHVLGRLESGHFVLYRRVWRDGVRSVQGVLLEPDRLLTGLVEAAYRESAVARSAALEVRFGGAALAHYAPAAGTSYASAPPEGVGATLLEAALAAPFDALTLRLTAARLPPAPGAGVVAWTALVLALVLTGGLAALYALGARAVLLAQAQRDFVTRVSHELRTPLTAIRMYGEMLMHGWADEARRTEYHTYIHDEAQRLSRLIENVLSFGRASRDGPRLTLTETTVGALADLLRSRLSAPVHAAGFTLHVDCPAEVAAARVRVDADAFTQVLMNLADNALKFAAQARVRVVEVAVTAGGGTVCFAVRDHGPGIARRDLKRVFRPFYRAAAARTAPGTGIGLPLARALARAMGGQVRARNAHPGAVFTLTLPGA